MSENQKRVVFSFRARLVIVMTVLLLGSFALVQYLNQRAQNQVQDALEQQKVRVDDTFFAHVTDITQATTFALECIPKREYMYEILKEPEYKNAINRERMRHLLIVEPSGEITDSIDPDLRHSIIRVPDVAAGAPGGRVERGNAVDALVDDADPNSEMEDTYWTRIEVFPTDSGEKQAKQITWIAIVVSNRDVVQTIEESQHQVADVIETTALTQSRLTLGIFALAVVLTILLVYRFTRPIRQLSDAAERVAGGDLEFAVDITRRDEMGQLARTFNGMISGLKAKAELEDRLNNAERAAVIGRLTSAIAHEIRNPLNFINLSIDRVRTKYPPTDENDRERFDKLLGSIKEETGRLNRLVTDVLNFGRPASLNVRTFDLRQTVEAVLAIVRTPAEEQGVEIVSDVPFKEVMVEADAEKLKSCFSNIAINAVQAMPDGGRLLITIDGDDRECRVVFKDSGVGIPEEALDRVFEPYYSTKDTGTGLGLAVTKKIVEEHGGRIRVESAPGEGTTFEIDLPRERKGSPARERRTLAGVKP